jgi:hypothetical protein
LFILAGENRIPTGQEFHFIPKTVTCLAIQDSLRVIPEIDTANSALTGAPQIDLATLPAPGNVRADVDPLWLAVLVDDNQPLEI